jgi:hypothetical protein
MKCPTYNICQQGSPKKTHVHISRHGVSRPRNRGDKRYATEIAADSWKLRSREISVYFRVGFVILSTLTMKSIFTLWNMMPCIPIKVNWRFVWKYRLHFQVGKLRQAYRKYTAAVYFSETSVNINRIIRRHIQQGSNSTWTIILLKLTINRHLFWSDNRVVCWWRYRAHFMVNTSQRWDSRCYVSVQQMS